MQFRIRNNDNSADDGTRSQFLKVSSALFLAGSVLLSLPMVSEAFVPSSSLQHKAPSTRLFYTMPDVTNMKARDMKTELESYGVNTQTLFDKREFEQALIEARRNYEQTLNDVMGSARISNKEPPKKRKTVNYNRSEHSNERIYSSENTNDQPHNMSDEQFLRKQKEAQQQQQQRQQQKRQRRHYQAEPNPVGNFDNFESSYVNKNGPQNVNVGGGSRRRRGNEWFEEDPLFAHEAETQHFRSEDHHYHHDPRDPRFEEYEVGGRRPPPRTPYSDSAQEMRYQKALQEAYKMKVEDIQYELNCRGITTNHCMIFKDFCTEYAKAIAENRQKLVEEPANSDSLGDDDDDYDPSYRDVVMQKFEPSAWV
jgi:hypothetical protein